MGYVGLHLIRVAGFPWFEQLFFRMLPGDSYVVMTRFVVGDDNIPPKKLHKSLQVETSYAKKE